MEECIRLLSGLAIMQQVKLAKSDVDQDCANKYAIIDGDGITFTTGTITKFSINKSKESIEANNTDYCDFTGVPQGTTIKLQGVSDQTMDSSGTLRFKAVDAGAYMITFIKPQYASLSLSIEAQDGYLYDNITGQ